MAEETDTKNHLDLATTVEVERDFQFQLRRSEALQVPFYFYDLDKASPEDVARGCSRQDFIKLALDHCREHALKEFSYPENAIYVIESGGKCKIGVSRDPGRRLKTLQGSNWDKLRLRSLFWTDEERVFAFESFCLATAKTAGLERRLEWVGASAETAATLIAKCAQAWGLRVADSGMWMLHRHAAENAARNFSDFGRFGRLTKRP